MRSLRLLCALALVSLVLSGCAGATSGTPAAASTATVIVIVPTGEATSAVLPPLENIPVVARVNGVDITSEYYGKELLRAARLLVQDYGMDWSSTKGQSELPRVRENTLNQLIDQELTRQLAEAEKVTVSQVELQRAVNVARQQIIQKQNYSSWQQFLQDYVTSDEEFAESIRRGLLYQKMVSLHGGPAEVEQVRALHILVKTEADGQKVLERLAAGEDFEKVAREVSIDPAVKKDGAVLDWFPRGMMPSAFEQVAFELKVGETSGLIKTDFGYHVLRILGHEVRPLKTELLKRFQQQHFDQWFAEVRVKAHIERLVTFLSP